ncbi:hypothetical protein PCANC_22307 [Puccinia coronata f. sp. avenae]|uniref:Uncharacterized protein n=1 Tax=Puccinia coronata f. sp. avenae TaxID=200324 RepID=A0A2N5TRU0_9BASI|nr:hypothetical protein PCANC_22307 [Puccinia coronata f. sp. avenae]
MPAPLAVVILYLLVLLGLTSESQVIALPRMRPRDPQPCFDDSNEVSGLKFPPDSGNPFNAEQTGTDRYLPGNEGIQSSSPTTESERHNYDRASGKRLKTLPGTGSQYELESSSKPANMGYLSDIHPSTQLPEFHVTNKLPVLFYPIKNLWTG